MARILVLGATGYIGGRLVPRLLERGQHVRCLIRDPNKLTGLNRSGVEIITGDLLKPDSLPPAFQGIDIVYYLVHSMSATGKDFEKRDRSAAWCVATLSNLYGVKRIIYLGGLGKRSAAQSPHLRSRHEVGDILRSGSVPVTEFRAAVIIGSGSVSFEMIHHLVNKLPVMITPRWVDTRTQPIGIRDVLSYLVDAIDLPRTTGKSYDIGGPDVLTYREMMLSVARTLGLHRSLLRVPVLTPRLSSYWINLVTPIPSQLARALIESLRQETVCESDAALRDFDFVPMRFESSVRLALDRLRTHDVETAWSNASLTDQSSPIDPSHLLEDVRIASADAPPELLFTVVSSIGGRNGWPYADKLWRLRGFIDKQLGGVGLRSGRRHPSHLRVGDILDFWRVEEYIEGKRILLRAEMKVWGKAWLEFRIEPDGPYASKLTQIARYYPSGLSGYLYWYGIYPIHSFVFRGMVKAIAARTEMMNLNFLHAA